MINLSVLSVFVPTFFMVSLTPGMCMTLSMTLGMTIGVRRALWMMLGELVGVGLVAVSAVIGVATLMLRYPEMFAAFKWLGGAYLIYLGVMMWRSKGRMAIPDASDAMPSVTPLQLILQGFVTAVANPKGWAFFIALLPPFLDAGRPMAPQLVVLVGVILTLELTCLLIYAGGGRTASRFLRRDGNVRLLNRVAGSLMMGVGVWLALG
ncbi:threonine/homoserine/homoserine lactone efflux protein [Chromohalobacter marismortui]|uniref:Threonine/homoserine/homoserine lactone efflux protein n=1 Tax=Chromohalobacter marismortui TaxID=42055 RepID=A0A4R7NVE9_9GAMM|nr:MULTISPECIES: LysE family translocator [Chromohalobacter]MCI0510436.1 LysE family translocator [Chromohalobacter sp.]MCI0594690.1 LysE family translocator [Chromohalobacter sp.]TDU24988.1 threonine/homoserine/homoserine lactone efflux protein [Chromohalobacter marismortui]